MFKDRPDNVTILAVMLLVVGGYALMALHFPIAYIWATYEDLVGEWAQTYAFLFAALLFVFAAKRNPQYRWFFALMAVACSYVFLEEISWGQRIFGFDTPDILKSRNLQGEANIHNLFTGPHKTLLKELISVGLALGLVGYGAVYPILLRLGWGPARWVERLGVAAPPLALAPYFAIAAFLELKPFTFNEAEIAELLIALALAITALYYAFTGKPGVHARGRQWTQSDSLVFGQYVVMIVTTVLVIAAATTVAFYSIDESKARIDRRIANGIEKFAGRYERYDRCDVSITLYKMLLQSEPRRVFILRKLAECYRDLGELELFRQTVDQAIAIDLERQAADPWRASVHQSLVRSYRLADDELQAQSHLDEAFRIGEGRIASHPDSASAAYSYGRTLQLAGRKEDAFEQFSRAYELDPTSSRYRSAYFAARAVLQN